MTENEERFDEKKVYMVLVCIVFFVITFTIVYQCYLRRVDTKYAVNLSKAFDTYDIRMIDDYLSDDTKIIYQGEVKTYKELRENVIIACEEKRYSFFDGSSYGFGNDRFIDGVQDIRVLLHGKFDGITFPECNILMKLRQTGIFEFRVESLECSEPIFAYLFYGDSNRVE